MMYLIGEARNVIQVKRTYKDQSWIETTLKVELENGSDILLQLNKEMNTDENILFLKTLKGSKIKCQFWNRVNAKDNKVYSTYYIVELPSICGK